jgi:hypothetical protein
MKAPPVTVHVVMETIEGVVQDPVVYQNENDAESHFKRCLRENGLTREYPYNDQYEVSLSNCEVIKPRMVLARYRQAMARLEALCS